MPPVRKTIYAANVGDIELLVAGGHRPCFKDSLHISGSEARGGRRRWSSKLAHLLPLPHQVLRIIVHRHA